MKRGLFLILDNNDLLLYVIKLLLRFYFLLFFIAFIELVLFPIR